MMEDCGTDQAEPEAVMHRPLTQGHPMMFPFEGVCPEASEASNDQCVAHQLAAHLLSERALMWSGRPVSI